MNEYEVAKEKVLPYVSVELGWPKHLISEYGRVPVQIGGSTVWADFVCYICKDQKLIPWLLVEVKKQGISLEQAMPQAESYSLILGALFFCVTDGDRFDFYATGNSQGKSIRLESMPSIPTSEYLIPREKIIFPQRIYELIELFLKGLKEEDKFLEDTKVHDDAVKQIQEKIFQRLDFLTSQELKDVFSSKYVMMKPPNKNLIFSQIDKDFLRFKKVLKFIHDFKGDPVTNIKDLLDKKGSLYIQGGGIFFIIQLLAGAHPNEYIVLEENVSRALRYLGITDILVKSDTANGYVFINEICKKLFRDKLEHKLKEYGSGLAAVHNFLWHYYVCYRKEKKWSS